jgi:hypothetical protein
MINKEILRVIKKRLLAGRLLPTPDPDRPFQTNHHCDAVMIHLRPNERDDLIDLITGYVNDR